jgi:xanthine dehydrogenase YagS FAD-binding subunit
VQPSDPLVALAALDAEVEIASRAGHRTLAVADLHLTQQEAASAGLDAALAETRLKPGEVIVGYRVPPTLASGSATSRSGERKLRIRARRRRRVSSRSNRAALSRAAVALGSVAQKPWRLHAAEARLVGQPPTRDVVFPILTAGLADARPLAHNGYKLAMAAGAATRAIVEAAA